MSGSSIKLSAKKRNSEEIAVVKNYGNSLEHGKDLNDSVTEPKLNEDDSLERADKSMSFSS